ncbi:Serine/threonine-protein kinase haspin [Chamberlinius hualienensis]
MMFERNRWTLKTYGSQAKLKFTVPWSVFVNTEDPFDAVLALPKKQVPTVTESELSDAGFQCDETSVEAELYQTSSSQEFYVTPVKPKKAVVETTKKGKVTQTRKEAKKRTKNQETLTVNVNSLVTKRVKASESTEIVVLRDRNGGADKRSGRKVKESVAVLDKSDKQQNKKTPNTRNRQNKTIQINVDESIEKENSELYDSSAEFKKTFLTETPAKKKNIKAIFRSLKDIIEDDKEFPCDANLCTKSTGKKTEKTSVKPSTSKNECNGVSHFRNKESTAVLGEKLNSTLHPLEAANKSDSVQIIYDGRSTNVDENATSKRPNVRFKDSDELACSEVKENCVTSNHKNNHKTIPQLKSSNRAISTPMNTKVLRSAQRVSALDLGLLAISPICLSHSAAKSHRSFSSTDRLASLRSSVRNNNSANVSSSLSILHSVCMTKNHTSTPEKRSFIAEVFHKSSNFSKSFERVTSLTKNSRTALANCSASDLSLMFVERKPPCHTSAIDAILQLCDQKTIVNFDFVFPKRLSSLTTAKIGEGAYADVYKVIVGGVVLVVKVIPLSGNSLGKEVQPSFSDVLSELVITKALSKLREDKVNACSSFINVVQMNLVKGPYLSTLVRAWKRYDNEFESENENPENFPDDQNYMVFKFEDGGSDLERLPISNPNEVLSIVRQLTCSLAVAEKAFAFEHRDLHLGNILVSKTKTPCVTFVLNGKSIDVKTSGVIVKIIDYTLSRIEKNNVNIYTNLAEQEELFNGQGDSQYEVYRQMKKLNNNNWEDYNPQTNILWMCHVLEKMMSVLKRPQSIDRAASFDELLQILACLKGSTSTYDLVSKQYYS